MDTHKENLLASLTLPNIFKHFGVEIKTTGSGTTLKYQCPFHGDKTPSLQDNEGKHTAHCYGCGYHSDYLGVIAKFEGYDNDRDFSKVLKIAEEITGISAPTNGDRRKISKKSEYRSVKRISRPGERPLTDLGNSERIIDYCSPDLLNCSEFNSWLAWDGTRYEKSEEKALEIAKKMPKKIYAEASKVAGKEKRQAFADHAVRSESYPKIKAALSLARSCPEVLIKSELLDADIYALNVANGTLDLKTGELRPHSREDLITKLCPTQFDDRATCERWITFQNEVSGGNKDVIRFKQKILGYSLTGDVSERILVMLFGPGANGKSTEVEVVRHVLGDDYAQRTPADTLIKRQQQGIPNNIARLKGARFVTASETDEGSRFNESLIKDLTGNEKISARFLHGEFFDFRPQCKIFLSTNHKPIIKGSDKAIWDRIRVIPFSVTIPEERQDKHLLDKLKEEASGILTWMVAGCLAWQHEGLVTPDAVKNAVEGYRSDMDVIGRFLTESCRTVEDIPTDEALQVKVQSKVLYGAYKKWCEQCGEYAISQKKLSLRLQERGIQKTKGAGNKTFWLGLELEGEFTQETLP
ncbi:phage/plasmid primase, P4 family [Oligoflexia bacterium]|nr:phage/plasmid primase, P4 family [Oligoflexia bacterium]